MTAEDLDKYQAANNMFNWQLRAMKLSSIALGLATIAKYHLEPFMPDVADKLVVDIVSFGGMLGDNTATLSVTNGPQEILLITYKWSDKGEPWTTEVEKWEVGIPTHLLDLWVWFATH